MPIRFAILCLVLAISGSAHAVMKTGPSVFDVVSVKLYRAEAASLRPDAPNAPSLMTAVREQLGLRLESARAPIEVLVVDAVRPPAENQVRGNAFTTI
jgi:hypothetical protein